MNNNLQKDILYLISFSYKSKKYCKIGVTNALRTRISYLERLEGLEVEDTYFLRTKLRKGQSFNFNIEQYLLKITPLSKSIEQTFKGKIGGWSEIRETKHFSQLKRNLIHLPTLFPDLDNKLKRLSSK